MPGSLQSHPSRWFWINSPQFKRADTEYLSKNKFNYVTALLKALLWGFLGLPVVKNPPADAGDTGPILGLGRLHMLRSN